MYSRLRQHQLVRRVARRLRRAIGRPVTADNAAALRQDERRLVETSGLFDGAWYLKEYQDVAAAGVDPLDHYLNDGALEGRNPGPKFNTKKHLRRFPLLRRGGVNPLVHHIRIQQGILPYRPQFEPGFEIRTFSDFLKVSVFSPLIECPYSPTEQYLISYLESRRAHLGRLYEGRGQETLVSVVMATYNRAHCIGDAIESLRKQSYRNWELVVVDDCGSDDTEEVVRAVGDARIRYVRLDRNLGPSGARNAALERVSGEFVCYLDSDNTMEDDFLLILANELKEATDYDLVYCAQRAVRTTANGRADVHVRFGVFHRPALENHNYIDLGAIMHRRTLVERHGPFNTALRRLVDWDLILRYTAEKPARAVPSILSTYHYDANNRQVTSLQSLETNLAQLDAALMADPVGPSLPDVALEGLSEMFSAPQIRFSGERRPVSVVIPNFEALDYLKACIDSLYAFTPQGLFEIIVVDNASSRPVVDYLTEQDAMGRLRLVRNETNLGFTHAVNQGIALAASSNDVLILNNDAVMTRGWLEALQQVLADHPETGLVVPRQVLPKGEPSIPLHQPYAEPDRECDVNISAHHGNVVDPLFDAPRGYIELSYAPFFCVYVPRHTLAELGPLDVVNGPHYRSDRLYCDLVRDVARRRILYTPHAKVYHFVQRATAQLKQADATLYQKMFVRNDWSAISQHAGGKSAAAR
jgi:glycosyltransferase involved in cell wall biosynthesis